eukprot:EW711936.1.p1 GENE.EW711936.1~~EW711936.1.p1  ORF type:complete len:103 (+),score=24.88 EW711936.1:197-505(+)
MINLTNKNLSDDKLNQLLLNAPPNSIVLLEDIDHALSAVGSRDVSLKPRISSDEYEEIGDGLSLSGLLNAIDGVCAQEGRIFICTTNHLDRLPDALIRPRPY